MGLLCLVGGAAEGLAWALPPNTQDSFPASLMGLCCDPHLAS